MLISYMNIYMILVCTIEFRRERMNDPILIHSEAGCLVFEIMGKRMAAFNYINMKGL